MTNFLRHPLTSGLVKLNGEISNYKVRRQSASFVFTGSDQTKLGVIAIAASLAGMGGQAMSVASNATSIEEDADYVEFCLNGNNITGWVWRSPFQDGDEVNIAAEWQIDHYEVFAISRPRDKMIALYPHCSRAKTRHIKNAVKWWSIVTVSIESITVFSFATDGMDEFKEFLGSAFSQGAGWFLAGLAIFTAIAIASMTKQWMPFVKLSEKIFRTLELPGAYNIDLVKSSKKQRTNQDAPEFGSMYFRY